MNTVADKLMKLVQTKSDIRQALLDKGFNVPDTMPFSGYADLIRRFPCNAKDFPDIPGMIARWSAKGLTNEDMSTNPVWKDLTGNGHDLQMKNFAWGGMSGVGGHSDENYRTSYKFSLDDYVFIAIKPGAKHINFTFRVTGLQPGNKLTLAFFGTTNTVYGTWDKDGIYTVNSAVVEVGKPVYFYNGYGATRGEFTIEILPLYPGALVFDGVDDYGVCDNFPILTKEKGYTVVALRSIIDKNIPGYLLSNSAGPNQGAFIFERTIDSLTASFGKSSPITVNYNNPLTYQTTSKYNQKSISVGELLEGGKSLVVGRNSKEGNLYANAAIWELVFLDHDATEEELTKIKDYFVKTYPWLFPDQAWTVTGKTNEDEDRATIANITGNSNDLVLSNFGFVEGSGYNEEGEYAGYLVTDGVDDKVVSAESIAFTDTWTIITDTVFLGKVSVASGILASNIFTVYNYQGSGTIAVTMGEGGSSLRVITSSIKAFSSDGTIYDAEWNEYHVEIGTIRALERLLKIGTSSNETSYFCQLAFKFLGIYNNQILSKDDCIKAYNYLQTLKAK